ncbi:ABC transporter substrate-binding protein [Brachybacterium hainanense]|uniref:ABC transporter substrate-binding protein n=1 Tax=Brachybacterium hainanense TaxID=1541174 RepID=A0ABV6R6S7_9MICO
MDLSRRSFLGAAGAAASALAITGCNRGGGGGEVTFLTGNDPNNIAAAEALVKAFNESQEAFTFRVDSRPGGTEGDNLIKTRLSTKDIADAFNYNSGSLFQAISPAVNLTDLSDQEWVSRVVDTYKPAVTAEDKIYGAPYGGSNAGGVLYHRPTYEKLGLEVPLTWDDFVANCEAAKASGIDGIIQSYGETWTSQFIVLADFHNVAAVNPDFAAQYTAHEIGFADDPTAFRAFERYQQVTSSDFINEDYVSATYQQAVGYVATGAGAHYPIFASAVTEIQASNPDAIEDVGFFALPGDDAATNGLTVWLPDGMYVPAFAENVEAAKALVAFVTSKEGLAAMATVSQPTGPYMVSDVELPAEVPGAVKDLQAYFEKDGATTPALEFSSPIKGPNLENILIELGTGSIDAKTAAQNYDKDVEKQAQQLGLEGW